MALRLHGGCSRAYKRPKAQSPQEKTGAKDEHGIRGRGGGAFSRNGLALISLSVGGRADMGERERNRPTPHMVFRVYCQAWESRR